MSNEDVKIETISHLPNLDLLLYGGSIQWYDSGLLYPAIMAGECYD